MTESVQFRPYVAPEDHARADFYALCSRLFADAPDGALLQALAAAAPLETDDPGAPLALAWSNLIALASVADAAAFAEEYDALFVGVGKAPLNLHGSHHLTGFMMETPLAEVRTSLQRLGLARLADSNIAEDHLSTLLEVMRVLIVGADDVAPQQLTAQREFFNAHISAWFKPCLTAIVKSPLANLYKPIAQFVDNYLTLEQEGFALVD